MKISKKSFWINKHFFKWSWTSLPMKLMKNTLLTVSKLIAIGVMPCQYEDGILSHGKYSTFKLKLSGLELSVIFPTYFISLKFSMNQFNRYRPLVSKNSRKFHMFLSVRYVSDWRKTFYFNFWCLGSDLQKRLFYLSLRYLYADWRKTCITIVNA